MSPLFTVAAYRFIFNIRYTTATYLSLIPLTLGVMLACSVEFRGNIFGVLMAFVGAVIFVSQNIFSKKLFSESSLAHDPTVPPHRRKLDKLNLLAYSSGQAFLLTIPLWLYSEGGTLWSEYNSDGGIELQKEGKHGPALSGSELVGEFVFNGTVHFGQNIIAFVLLSLVSPVTYSVASLIKRIFVIVMAIAWFGNPTTNLQAVGIALTYYCPPPDSSSWANKSGSSVYTFTTAPATKHGKRRRYWSSSSSSVGLRRCFRSTHGQMARG